MIKDGKRYLNLENQVEWNKNHIEGFLAGTETLNNFGIKVLGIVPTEKDIPKEGPYSYGDAYAVGDNPPYNYYIYTRSGLEAVNGTFVNIGIFPGVGPKGDTGAPGKDGENGKTPYIGANFHWYIGDVDTGISAKGIQGERGLQGIPGPKGAAGGYTLYGELSSISELPTPTKDLQSASAAYVVNGNLYMVMGVSAFEWYNLGAVGGTGLRGEPGIGIDTMTKVTAPYGEPTVTYDTTDGIHLTGDVRIDYGEDSYKQVDIDMSMPIKAGVGLSMDATEDGESVEVKADRTWIYNEIYDQTYPLQESKRDLVTPAAYGGYTRLYAAYPPTTEGGTGTQGHIISSGTYMEPGVVVQRGGNGQINLPDQSTVKPSDNQAISKKYAGDYLASIFKNTSGATAVPVFKAGESTPYNYTAMQYVASDPTFGTKYAPYSIAQRDSNGNIKDYYEGTNSTLITKAEADATYNPKSNGTVLVYNYATPENKSTLTNDDFASAVQNYEDGNNVNITLTNALSGRFRNGTVIRIANLSPADPDAPVQYPQEFVSLVGGTIETGADGSTKYSTAGFAFVGLTRGGAFVFTKYDGDGFMTRILWDNYFPASATNGTLENEFIKQSILKRDRSIIRFNNEIYWKADIGHTSGYITYTHTGYENSTFIHKAITINTNNWSWVLNTSE